MVCVRKSSRGAVLVEYSSTLCLVALIAISSLLSISSGINSAMNQTALNFHDGDRTISSEGGFNLMGGGSESTNQTGVQEMCDNPDGDCDDGSAFFSSNNP